MTTDPDSILEDDGINCIVEVMGGTGLAKRVVETALKKGKAVVTANKALLAEYWSELQQLLKENPTARLAWEAAVCGGIPVIQILQTAYTPADAISSISGICNGTTNFMLTQMFVQGAAYDQVLKQAQDLGYAEADPTADVEGHDVRAKIALLAQLAFGGVVGPVEQVPCKGISKITEEDFGYARILKSTIKLVGTARRSEETGAVAVYVTPALIEENHPLASIHGVGNAVTIVSRNLGSCSYSGPGAGRYPTANSIVADLYRLAMGSSTGPITENANTILALDTNYTASFFIRVPVQLPGPSVIRQTATLAEQHGVNIRSILQNTGPNFCILTDVCKLDQVEGMVAAIAKEEFTGLQEPFFMPVMKA